MVAAAVVAAAVAVAVGAQGKVDQLGGSRRSHKDLVDSRGAQGVVDTEEHLEKSS